MNDLNPNEDKMRRILTGPFDGSSGWATPSDSVWEGIEAAIPQKRKRRFLLWWVPFLFMAGALTWLLWPSPPVNPPSLQEESSSRTPSLATRPADPATGLTLPKTESLSTIPAVSPIPSSTPMPPVPAPSSLSRPTPAMTRPAPATGSGQPAVSPVLTDPERASGPQGNTSSPAAADPALPEMPAIAPYSEEDDIIAEMPPPDIRAAKPEEAAKPEDASTPAPVTPDSESASVLPPAGPEAENPDAASPTAPLSGTPAVIPPPALSGTHHLVAWGHGTGAGRNIDGVAPAGPRPAEVEREQDNLRLGLGYQFITRAGWFVRTGIDYQRFREQTTHERTWTFTRQQGQPVPGGFRQQLPMTLQTGFGEMETDLRVSVVERMAPLDYQEGEKVQLRLQLDQTLHQIRWPVDLGYQRKFGKWTADASAGAALVFLAGYEASLTRVIENRNRIRLREMPALRRPEGLSTVSLDLHAGGRIGYQAAPDWNIGLGYEYWFMPIPVAERPGYSSYLNGHGFTLSVQASL